MELEDTKHECAGEWVERGWTAAVTSCYENELDELWVSNGEYSSRVNFCPYCGYPAKKPVTSLPLREIK